MTPQEIFNKAYLGIYNQGQRALKRGACAYSGDSGTACAVGILFDDKEYRDFLEYKGGGLAIVELPQKIHESLPLWVNQNVGLLMELQEAHDRTVEGHFRETWTARCQKIAEEFELDMPREEKQDDK